MLKSKPKVSKISNYGTKVQPTSMKMEVHGCTVDPEKEVRPNIRVDRAYETAHMYLYIYKYIFIYMHRY